MYWFDHCIFEAVRSHKHPNMASTFPHRISAELCRTVTKAEVIHRRRQILALQTLHQDENYAIHDVADSTTILSPAVHGRKLNHTYGFGMFGPVTMGNLRSVENAYEAWSPEEDSRPRPEIDVCEYAHASTFDLLSKDYSITGSVCQFQRDLADFETPPARADSDVKVHLLRGSGLVTDHDTSYADFIDASVQGFRSGGRNTLTLRALAESAVARSDTNLYSAKINGELVGTAVMAVIDVGGCKVACLFMDSCLEHARGKGVHIALLLERIRVAKEVGCEMVIAAAREGSGSARNIERAGLGKVFTCKTYTQNTNH
jgi:hypothetical protein